MNEKQSIPLHQMGNLEIHDDNRLYWDGKPVVTEEKIKLGGWVNFAIIVAAISTSAMAVVEILRYLGVTVK